MATRRVVFDVERRPSWLTAPTGQNPPQFTGRPLPGPYDFDVVAYIVENAISSAVSRKRIAGTIQFQAPVWQTPARLDASFINIDGYFTVLATSFGSRIVYSLIQALPAKTSGSLASDGRITYRLLQPGMHTFGVNAKAVPALDAQPGAEFLTQPVTPRTFEVFALNTIDARTAAQLVSDIVQSLIDQDIVPESPAAIGFAALTADISEYCDARVIIYSIAPSTDASTRASATLEVDGYPLLRHAIDNRKHTILAQTQASADDGRSWVLWQASTSLPTAFVVVLNRKTLEVSVGAVAGTGARTETPRFAVSHLPVSWRNAYLIPNGPGARLSASIFLTAPQDPRVPTMLDSLRPPHTWDLLTDAGLFRTGYPIRILFERSGLQCSVLDLTVPGLTGVGTTTVQGVPVSPTGAYMVRVRATDPVSKLYTAKRVLLDTLELEWYFDAKRLAASARPGSRALFTSSSAAATVNAPVFSEVTNYTPPTFVTDPSGQYLAQFDAVYDRVLGTSAFQVSRQFTLAMRIRPSMLGRTMTCLSVPLSDGAGELTLSITAIGAFSATCKLAGGESSVTCSGGLTQAGQWTSVALVHYSDRIALVVDGTQVSSATQSSGGTAPVGVVAAAIGGTQQKRFVGDISHVRLYQSALLPEQATQFADQTAYVAYLQTERRVGDAVNTRAFLTGASDAASVQSAKSIPAVALTCATSGRSVQVTGSLSGTGQTFAVARSVATRRQSSVEAYAVEWMLVNAALPVWQTPTPDYLAMTYSNEVLFVQLSATPATVQYRLGVWEGVQNGERTISIQGSNLEVYIPQSARAVRVDAIVDRDSVASRLIFTQAFDRVDLRTPAQVVSDSESTLSAQPSTCSRSTLDPAPAPSLRYGVKVAYVFDIAAPQSSVIVKLGATTIVTHANGQTGPRVQTGSQSSATGARRAVLLSVSPSGEVRVYAAGGDLTSSVGAIDVTTKPTFELAGGARVGAAHLVPSWDSGLQTIGNYLLEFPGFRTPQQIIYVHAAEPFVETPLIANAPSWATYSLLGSTAVTSPAVNKASAQLSGTVANDGSASMTLRAQRLDSTYLDARINLFALTLKWPSRDLGEATVGVRKVVSYIVTSSFQVVLSVSAGDTGPDNGYAFSVERGTGSEGALAILSSVVGPRTGRVAAICQGVRREREVYILIRHVAPSWQDGGLGRSTIVFAKHAFVHHAGTAYTRSGSVTYTLIGVSPSRTGDIVHVDETTGLVSATLDGNALVRVQASAPDGVLADSTYDLNVTAYSVIAAEPSPIYERLPDVTAMARYDTLATAARPTPLRYIPQTDKVTLRGGGVLVYALRMGAGPKSLDSHIEAVLPGICSISHTPHSEDNSVAFTVVTVAGSSATGKVSARLSGERLTTIITVEWDAKGGTFLYAGGIRTPSASTYGSSVALQSVNGYTFQEGAVYRVFRTEARTAAPEPLSDAARFMGPALLTCLEAWSTQEWSVVIRLRLQASTSASRRVFTFWNTSNANEYAYLRIEPNSITWGWRPAGASSDVTMSTFASAVPAVDAWTVLSVKVGLSSILMYKDGALLTSMTNPFSPMNNYWNRLEVGGNLDGDISHIALFDRAISGGGKATVNGPSSVLMVESGPDPDSPDVGEYDPSHTYFDVYDASGVAAVGGLCIPTFPVSQRLYEWRAMTPQQ